MEDFLERRLPFRAALRAWVEHCLAERSPVLGLVRRSVPIAILA